MSKPSAKKLEPLARELEPSPCTNIPKRGYEDPLPRWTAGMNLRYKQDEVTHGPTGRQLTEGFRMMDDDYDGD